MSGSHYAPEPQRLGGHSDGPVGTLQQWMEQVDARLAALETAALRPDGGPSPGEGDEATRYDLPGPEALRLDKLDEALAYLTKRVDELTRSAMTDLSRTSHDVDRLRGTVDGVNRIAITAETATASHERRITALERTVGALERTAAHQADALQVLVDRKSVV